MSLPPSSAVAAPAGPSADAAPHADRPAPRPSSPAPRSSGLNPAQYEAVHTAPGPLLVLAGAGTGKTRVVIARIGHLVWRGAKPSRILAVTFTNKAAREMLARAQKGLKKGSQDKPEISTIHSLCVPTASRSSTAASRRRRRGRCSRS